MINNDWDIILEEIFSSKYFQNLKKIVEEEYLTKIIYPPKKDLYNALKLTSFSNVKVVIVGQDPYHGEGEANGLCFSVNKDIKIPPSLRNIYKELENDLGIKVSNNGNLTPWAKEGVLLLNATLTVEKDTPNSHKDIGWDKFTNYIIQKLNDKKDPIVFILWGNFAKSKKKFITNKNHLIIESTHPSPFSAYNGFFGSKPFSKTNNFLIKNNKKPINWKNENLG
ncbi:MAG: uracil-DNA glycosylase [Bacilli bacterium]|nr:uracil-DNA glycosylase [Bacilli bacterium]